MVLLIVDIINLQAKSLTCNWKSGVTFFLSVLLSHYQALLSELVNTAVILRWRKGLVLTAYCFAGGFYTLI